MESIKIGSSMSRSGQEQEAFNFEQDGVFLLFLNNNYTLIPYGTFSRLQSDQKGCEGAEYTLGSNLDEENHVYKLVTDRGETIRFNMSNLQNAFAMTFEGDFCNVDACVFVSTMVVGDESYKSFYKNVWHYSKITHVVANKLISTESHKMMLQQFGDIEHKEVLAQHNLTHKKK